MDKATLSRAVEPFFSTKGIGRGTGLGLSMVHGLASQLGGAMNLSSKVGVGTNVELWLPKMDESTRPELTASTPAAGALLMGTVLLVDDEKLVREATADMLEDFGYRVVQASSAEEALRLARGGLQADILVTDHLMPGMNGTDLARTMRAERLVSKVLIVSGYADLEGLDAEVPRLTKPFVRNELEACLMALSEDP